MTSKTSKKAPVQSQSWSVILFCYNEKDSVQRVAESVLKTLKQMAPGKFEIVIVDDGSADGSVEVIRGIKARFPKVKTVFHPRNMGIGTALRTGYANVRNENVCAVPADGQFDVRELLPFKTVPARTFISFFRKKQEGYSAFRRWLSGFNRRLNRILLGVRLRDVNWVKIYKLGELQKLDLQLKSSLVESEICAKLLSRGNKCLEIPSVYHRRQSGQARGASLKIIGKALFELARLAWVVLPWRFRGR